MTIKGQAWYHCGRCGELFRASYLDAPCEACGRNAHPHRTAGTPAAKSSSKEFVPKSSSDLVRTKVSIDGKSVATDRRERTERVRSKRSPMVTLVVVWVSILLVISVFVGWRLNHVSAVVQVSQEREQKADEMQRLSEDVTLLNASMQNCFEHFSGLLESVAPEIRAQYVFPQPSMSVKIARDAAKMALFLPEKMPELTQRQVLRVRDEPVIETLWSDDRGRKIEVVFRKKDEAWLVDWDSYVRSSDMPWAIFETAEGEGEGEFRFLVRERLAEQRALEDTLSLVFYEPSFWHGGDLGQKTPEMLVMRKSLEGRLISQALLARKEKRPVYRSMYSEQDPPDTARVRVVIQRKIVDGQREFRVKAVKACHWMGVDDVGLLPDG